MQKNKSINLYALAVTALLTAISLILARFSIMIPLFGYPSVRFSVSGIPIFLAGSLFGPVFGASAGFVSDIISFMVSGSGPYHPGFTINSILVGFIPGLIFMQIRKKGWQHSFNKWNAILGVVALVGAVIYVNFIGIHEIESLGEIMGIPINIVLTVLMIVLVGGLMVVVHWLQKRLGEHPQTFSVDKIIFICMMNYMMIQLVLTPIWLNQLYNIPVSASIFVRVFKSIVDIPLQASLIYIVFNALPATIKGRYTWKVQ